MQLISHQILRHGTWLKADSRIVLGYDARFLRRKRVRADGELLTCEPARELPLAQRYFLF